MGTNQRKDGTFKKSRRNKYSANGRHIDGHWFASKAEGDRYEQLKEMLKMGMIGDLRCQVPFPCKVNGILITTYLADFQYRINPGRMGTRLLVEDVKGMKLELYKIKLRLVQVLHDVRIVEIPVLPRSGVKDHRLLTGDQVGKPPTKEEAWTTGSSAGLLRSRGASQS